MLTRTKIALGAALFAGFATAASAQQVTVEPFGGPTVYADPAPYGGYYDDEPSVGIAVAPGARSRNIVRERDDFTGIAPRSRSDRYSDTPGNQ
jgi:hypothetical protein